MGFFSNREKRVHPNAATQWLIDLMGGREVASGVKVNANNATSVMAVWRAVHLLSGTIGMLPLNVRRYLPGGGKELDVEHPNYPILKWQVNPWQTAFEWREMMQGHAMLRGMAYSEKVMSNSDELVALVPLHPDKTRPLVENGQYVMAGGQLVYEHGFGENRRILFQDEMFVLRGLSRDGVIGIHPVEEGKEALGLAMAIEKHQAKFYGSGATLSGAIKAPSGLTDEQKKELKESFRGKYGGVDNHHAIALFEDGMEWQQIGLSQKDAETLAERKFAIDEVARWSGLPPHMLAQMDRATFSNIEQQSLEYVVYSVQPWATRWEQAIMRDLFTPEERRTHTVTFLFNALLRGEMKARFEAYAIGRQWGWLSADDVSELEDRNPLPDGQGQIYLVPMNMIPADQVGQDAAAATRERGLGLLRSRIDHAHLKVVAESVQRGIRREQVAVGRKSGKVDSEGFEVWVREFYAEHEGDFVRDLLPAAESYAETVRNMWLGDQADVEVEPVVMDAVGRWVSEAVDRARAAVLEAGNADELTEILNARTEDIPALLRFLGDAVIEFLNRRALPRAA